MMNQQLQKEYPNGKEVSILTYKNIENLQFSTRPQDVDLSVIIPVYNAEKYLNKCLESIINQPEILTYEIILIDDGSTDRSGKICDDYSKKYQWIRTIHQENRGSGLARNVGFENANGKYLWYVDSDDYIDREAFLKLSEYLLEDPDILLFSAESFADGVNVSQNNYKRKDCFGTILSGKEVLESNYCHGYYITSICLRIYNRRYLQNNGIVFSAERYYEDELYGFLSLFEASRVYTIHDTLYFRRYRAGSKMVEQSVRNEQTFVVAYDALKESMRRLLSLYEEKYSGDKYSYLILIRVFSFCEAIVCNYGYLDYNAADRHRQEIVEILKMISEFRMSMTLKQRIKFKYVNLYRLLKRVKMIAEDILFL